MKVKASILAAGLLMGCADPQQRLVAPTSDVSRSESGGVSTVHFNRKIPANIGIHNLCSGEDVFVSGNFHASGNLTFDASGNLKHLELHANSMNVAGEGATTGQRYRFVLAQNLIFHSFSTDARHFQFGTVIRMIGGEEKDVAHADFHIFVKIGADGTPHFQILRVTTACPGA